MLTKALYSRTLLLSVIMLIVFSSVSYSSDSFNYSKIAPHPRLLLSKADEGALKKVLKSNVQFSGIHDLIIKKSDEMLSKEALTYIKSGKRLLAVSREALQRIFFLSYSYRMTKNNEYLKRAELELNAVSKFDNWNPTHYLDVGEMYAMMKNDYDKALVYFYKSTEAKPEYAAAWFNLGYAYQHKEDLTKAIENYRMAVKLDTMDPKAVSNLAFCLNKTGNIEEAVSLNKRIIRLRPKMEMPYMNIAMYYFKQGDTLNAVKSLEDLLKEKPNAKRASRLLNRYYLSKGDTVKANYYFELFDKASGGKEE